MATALTAIQVHVRELGQQITYDIGTAGELARVNRINRRLYMLEKWPEARQQDSTLDTIAGTSVYTFPATPLFYDVTDMEVKDPYDDDKWKTIAPPEDELIWQLAGLESAEFPRMYQRSRSGTTNQVEFRPAPDFTGTNNIRITGYVEPVAFTASSESTPYFSTLLDDCLAYLIASDLMARKGLVEFSQMRFQSAAEIIRTITGREVTPKELGLAQ